MQQFRETSSIFELDKVKNEANLRDFLTTSKTKQFVFDVLQKMES